MHATLVAPPVEYDPCWQYPLADASPELEQYWPAGQDLQLLESKPSWYWPTGHGEQLGTDPAQYDPTGQTIGPEDTP